MKYNPRRNYLHPVLRPFSNDYPDGSLVTELEVNPSPEIITVAVNFQVSEPSIQEEIANGGAICAAMLYCGPTLYREMLRAGKGSVRAEAAIPAYMLRGEVLVHPAIFATADLSYQAPTVHEEYKASAIQIGQWNPMAVDRYWQFQVNPAERNTKGIFNLEIDKELPDGEFDIKCETNEKYISITANEETRAKLKLLGAQEQESLSTVYMSALVCALAEVKDLYEDDQVHEDGWVQCIKANMKRLKLDIGSPETTGTYTLFRAAQLLLNKPFESYLTITINRRTSGEEED